MFWHKRFYQTFFLAGFAVALVVFTPDTARAGSIEGNWGGSGSFTTSSGSTEPVRCRARITGNGGASFAVSARCVGSFGQINQSGDLQRVARNRYSGTLYNFEYNASARVRIRLRGNRQSVSISSSQGRANLTLVRR